MPTALNSSVLALDCVRAVINRLRAIRVSEMIEGNLDVVWIVGANPYKARAANQSLVDLLNAVAKRKNATPAQIALAWLLAQKPWIVPIPGTTKLHRLEENIGAAAVELSPGDLGEIDDAAARITVQGARYPERLEAMTGR